MIALLLLAAVAAALAVISCLGGNPDTYTSLPMTIAWGAIVCAGGYHIISRRLYRRKAVFAIHCALAVILGGALATHLLGTTETLKLRTGQPVTLGELTVELVDFHIEYYPGTMAPADFVSRLKIDGEEAVVAMNRVHTAKGYRFSQTGYDPDKLGSTLTVSCDAAGTAISYIGYGLLLAAMLCSLIPSRRFKRGWSTALLTVATLSASAAPKALPEATAAKFGELMVYNNGRIAPLSTLARDFTVKLTGGSSYKGLCAEQVLTGWIFYYDSWRNEPCIKLKDLKTRELLGIDGKFAALPDFFSPQGEYLPSGQGYEAANEKFGLASAAATGALWSIFPITTAKGVRWLSPADDIPAEMDLETWHFVSHCFNYMAELAANGQWTELQSVVEKIKGYQRQNAGDGAIPSHERVAAERLFNTLAPSLWPCITLLLTGLILFFRPHRRMARTLATAGVIWLTGLIALNWIASGRAPMSNGYETMQWMALAACLAGVAMPRRYGSATPLCLTVAALAMMVAMMGQRSPQVTQVVPVLRSPLLSLHVLTVMLAYAGLAINALCGAAWLCGRRDLLELSRRLLRPSVYLLAAGIFIGAVWANQSWGRYWGWDPKEVWALITMLTYAFPLHRGSLPWFNNDRHYSLYTLIAFLSVIMTYFGVNFVLGGLHGYAV